MNFLQRFSCAINKLGTDVPAPDWSSYEVQSGEQKFGVTINNAISTSKEQTTQFQDQNPAYSYKVDSMPDPTFDTSKSNDADLGNFFARPIKVASYEWATGATLFETFNPWTLFFENPRVINRISNYNLMRSKLHVKIILNGNGFHFGRAIASYKPLPDNDNLTVERGFFLQDVIQASQRPHIYLDPTHSQGGDLELPFFWYKNYLSIPDQEWRKMGDVTIHGMQQLKHANGADDRVTVSVFVWAEEVQLTIPTGNNPGALSPQSGFDLFEPHAGDEYGKGPVSRPASVVARAAGALRNAPIIGVYARATEIGANAVSSVATIFGYSRPIDVDPIHSFKPVLLGNMANTNAVDTSGKLSTDIKQELTIDSRVAGLGMADEMVIRDIAKRESYLTTFNWPVGTNSEKRLFTAVVDPGIHAVLDQGLLADELHFPACAFAVNPFKYWRGTMKYRFQIVASNFHKGRLKIVYEPSAIVGLTAEYNTNYTYVVDIAESKDFTVDIGWGKTQAFATHLGPGDPQSSMFTIGEGLPFHDGRGQTGNGFISVYVVNDLTVPNSLADNDVQVNVFVSADDDFEVAAPDESWIRDLSWLRPPTAASQFVPQSGVEQTDAEATTEPSRPLIEESDVRMAPALLPDDHTLDVFFGETIQSFRAMSKRYCLHKQIPFATTVDPGTIYHWFSFQYYFPTYRGYDINGFWNINGSSYTIAENTLVNYITPAYSGFRGGMRWKTHMWSDDEVSSTYTRVQREQSPFDATEYAAPVSVVNNLQSALDLSQFAPNGTSGMMAQSTAQNPILEFEVPSTTPWRFLPAKNTEWTVRRSADFDYDTTPQFFWDTVVDLPATSLLVRSDYVAAAEDFTCFFFTGAPIAYLYPDPVPLGKSVGGKWQQPSERLTKRVISQTLK